MFKELNGRDDQLEPIKKETPLISSLAIILREKIYK